MKKNRAFFLDRDGTLIEDRGYICGFDEVEIFPFSVEAVQLMNQNGFKVFVITNQSSIGRGICTEEQVKEIHREIKKYFLDRGAVIDEIYYCPYHENSVIERFRRNDECRKPSPGMILMATRDFDINLAESYVMGDMVTDILAGKNAGCQTVFVEDTKHPDKREELEKNGIKPDFMANNILSAVQLILKK